MKRTLSIYSAILVRQMYYPRILGKFRMANRPLSIGLKANSLLFEKVFRKQGNKIIMEMVVPFLTYLE